MDRSEPDFGWTFLGSLELVEIPQETSHSNCSLDGQQLRRTFDPATRADVRLPARRSVVDVRSASSRPILHEDFKIGT